MADHVPWWVINTLKGGTRKSTTAVFLAFALAASGDDDVVLVDADHGTQGVTDWASRVYAAGEELPFHVVQWAPSQGLLVPYVQQVIRDTSARRALIDVGGEAPEVLRQVLIKARLMVSPVGPEQGELGRMSATALLAHEARVPMYALLSRVPRAGVGAAKEARDYLVDEARVPVLETEIPQDRETYAHVWGTVPANLGQYGPLADELRMREAV